MQPVSPQEYNRVFNRLVHLRALTKNGKLQAVLEDLILNTVTVDDSQETKTVEGIRHAVRLYFELSDIPDHLYEVAVDSLIQKGHLLAMPNGLMVAPKFSAEIRKRIEQAHTLEREVRSEWLEEVERLFGNLASDSAETLWQVAIDYLARVFYRHGYQTIQLITNSTENDEPNGKLTTLVNEAINSHPSELPHDLIQRSISNFFKKTTPKRTAYLSQLLDGTFSYFALSGDELIARYLQNELKSLDVFLDTNFIFSILSLHHDAFVEVSAELMRLVEKHAIPFNLCYHADTLNELNNTLEILGGRLLRSKWPSAISRAALTSPSLSSFERKFHLLNSTSPVHPEDFVSRYRYMSQQLTEKGFTPKDILPLLDSEKHQLNEMVGSYDKFLREEFKRRRPKTYNSMKHDMSVLYAVEKLRQSDNFILDSGALLLTCDYSLYVFNKRYKAAGTNSSVLMPNMFLQLIRPFIVDNGDFDRKFVATFALPEFRTIHSEYSETISSILSVLAAYNDVSEQTATRILANETLVETLRATTEEPAFAEMVNNAIADDNNRLLEEIAALQRETEEKQEALRQAQLEKQKELELIEKEKANLMRAKESSEAEKVQAIQTLQQEISGFKQREKNARYVLAVSLSILGIASLVVLLTDAGVWPWLYNHPRKLGVVGTSALIWLAFCLTLADKKFRREATVALIVGILAALLTIIDYS